MASFLGIKVEYARLGLIDTVLIVHQIRSWRTFSRCTDRSPSSQTTPKPSWSLLNYLSAISRKIMREDYRSEQ
jgi:hypothetical protein